MNVVRLEEGGRYRHEKLILLECVSLTFTDMHSNSSIGQNKAVVSNNSNFRKVFRKHDPKSFCDVNGPGVTNKMQ